MKLSFLLILFVSVNSINAQFTQKIKADSVRIYNDNCNAELILENSTKGIKGFLFNKGNGRTEFRAASIKLNDSLYLLGGDTLKINPVTGYAISNWNTAYSWGNHSLAGYATASNTMTFTNKTWNGTIIGSSYGGAGSVNGLLKANGSGIVSAAVADVDFLTPSTAASTYLTTTAASSTYLMTSTAAATYLSTTAAASTYLMTSTAASTYLTTSAASSTYLMTSTAASTYLTPAVAASTYLTPLSASTTYLPLAGGTLTGPLYGTSGDFSSGIGGTLTTGSQPNVTSVGTLSSLSVSGQVNAGTLGGTIVTASQPNITSVGSLNSLTITGLLNAATLAGTIVTAAQPNIISVGTLQSLTVTGGVNASTVGGTIITAAQPNITSVGTLQSLTVTGDVNASTIGGTIITPTQPNITSVGTLSSLTVTNQINASSIGGTITTVSQPNITSIGTLSSLTVAGQISAATINGTMITAAQPDITSLGVLGSLTVTGLVNAGTLSGTIITAAQPNITSLGVLRELTVTGKVTAATFSGTITTPSQLNITRLGVLTALSVSGPVIVTDPGSVFSASSASTATTIYNDGAGDALDVTGNIAFVGTGKSFSIRQNSSFYNNVAVGASLTVGLGVTASDLTADRIVVSDVNKKLSSSTVSATALTNAVNSIANLTVSSTANLNNFNSYKTFYTLPSNPGLYLVTVGLDYQPVTNWMAVGIVYSSGTSAAFLTHQDGSNIFMQISGMDLQVSQNGTVTSINPPPAVPSYLTQSYRVLKLQ